MIIIHQHRRATRPSGITLLEVLIACGILVIGLASVAALLPAASSVFAEATAVDRGAALAANAAADLQFRGVVSAAQFQPGIKTLVVGDMFPNSAPFNAPPMKRVGNPPSAIEEAAYGRAWYGATASTLLPGATAEPGGLARVAVIVFKTAEPQTKVLKLGRDPSGVYKLKYDTQEERSLNGETPEAREANRRRFLPACSWAAVVKDGLVHWLRINSSWPTYEPGGKKPKGSFVAFADADGLDATVDVQAFSNVLRVEERILPLK